MERCPNCGSTVRSGAKFCTTCGFRLPEAGADPAVNGGRSPFDTTSSVTGRWSASGVTNAPAPAPDRPAAAAGEEAASAPAEAPVDEGEPSADAAATVTTEAPTEPEPSGTFAGWPAFASGYGPGGSSETDAAENGGARPSPSPLDVPPIVVENHQTVEEAVAAWSSGPESAGPPSAEAKDDEEAAEAAVPADATELSAEPAAPDQAVWEMPAAPDAEPVETPETGDALPPLDREAGETATVEPTAGEPAEVVTEPVAAPPPVETPGERAARLLAELTALLPALAAGTPAPGFDAAAVAADLAESRAAGDAEAETFRSLRAAVATAQARPRDVDVMLDLVARADAMAALIDAHDRHAAAIDGAIRKLRGEQDEEPAPRW